MCLAQPPLDCHPTLTSTSTPAQTSPPNQHSNLTKSSRPVRYVLRNMSLQRDLGAPIEETHAQNTSIETHRDVNEPKTALEAAGAGRVRKDISGAKAALDQLRRSLYKLLVIQSQNECCSGMGRLRAEGKSTSHLRSTFSSKEGSCASGPTNFALAMTRSNPKSSNPTTRASIACKRLWSGLFITQARHGRV
jgi:hypothetical protein